MSALRKLEAASHAVPLDANPATAHMFIIKPFTVSGLMSLFSTHPPTEARVQALLALPDNSRRRGWFLPFASVVRSHGRLGVRAGARGQLLVIEPLAARGSRPPFAR